MTFPIIFAHRGANRLAPENTLSAFRKAIELGARALEFDVQLSKDAVPIVIHDDSLERTTNGCGLVSDHSFAALKNLDAGAWFSPAFVDERLPSLEEVLQAFLPQAIYLNIELKENALGAKVLVQQVLALLKRLACSNTQVILSSFDREVLIQLAKKSQESPWAMALLIHQSQPDAIIFAKQYACLSVNPNVELLRGDQGKAFIAEAHSEQLKVFSYTINDKDEAKHLAAQGLDGFFTDNELLYASGEKGNDP